MNYKKTLLPIILLSIFTCSNHTISLFPIGKTLLQLPISTARAIFQHVQIQKAESINKEDFPFFYQLIKEVDQQYPTLELSKRDFKPGLQWSSYYNTITLPASDIEGVNEIMKKKLNGEEITETEQRHLNCATWLLLHEASHIKHHDFALRFGIAIGTDIAKYKAIEAIYKIRNQQEMSAFPLSYLYIIATSQAFLSYCRKQEKLADQFPLDYATKEVLEAGKDFLIRTDNAQTELIEALPLENAVKNCILYMINNLFTHPSPQDRIDRIDNAIEKRFPNNTQSSDEPTK